MLKYPHIILKSRDVLFADPTFDSYLKLKLPKPNKERVILERNELGRIISSKVSNYPFYYAQKQQNDKIQKMSNLVFEAKTHRKLTRLLELVALLAFAIYCMLKFGQFQYWHLTLYTGSGPELKDVKVEYLDRNNNGKPDTLKFTYKLIANTSLIGFGGTELCIGDYFRSFSCKNIHLYYPDPQTDTSGHELVCKGENTYVRYLYFNSIPRFTFGNTMMTLNMIGSEAGIAHRAYVFPDKLDFSNFEPLTIGREVNNYPNYVDATSPIENKVIQLKNSCRCRFDGCDNTNDIQLNTSQKYPAGLF